MARYQLCIIIIIIISLFYELKHKQMQSLRRFKNPLSGIVFDVVHASCIIIDQILYVSYKSIHSIL